MDAAEQVRAHFAGRRFGPPATEAAVRRAEDALGGPIPPILRELYLAFDGFDGPTGAAFLWPLSEPVAGGLVELNLFFRGDDLFPHELVSVCLFFGDNGIGPQWGLHQDRPGQVIRWDARWGTEVEVAGATPLEVWLTERRLYDEVTGE